MPDALPAVTTPSFLKTDFNLARPSRVACGLNETGKNYSIEIIALNFICRTYFGCSSTENSTSLPLIFTGNGAISVLNTP